METVCSSEVLVLAYRRYNLEDQHRHLHRRQILRCIIQILLSVCCRWVSCRLPAWTANECLITINVSPIWPVIQLIMSRLVKFTEALRMVYYLHLSKFCTTLSITFHISVFLLRVHTELVHAILSPVRPLIVCTKLLLCKQLVFTSEQEVFLLLCETTCLILWRQKHFAI